ncbi:helix-turn-helix transcriptional regulator [Frondihabitans sp. VKM Ac-2883]|uniref:helix-turn-helix domain-containing protein n=1 Tax=Frondihabitans sp. VKM Ac-2883 TaxID=2783823 RepID=UPI00188C01DA|nr:helix-turn-helix transcriptional regulator [Frondihabitans sp. VKM Ac-2883]MBF4575050.1 helix-turn-helix transcriptional regulator [Frondihabitans sp. VKM Ac-2883]
MSAPLTPYGELLDIFAALPVLIRDKRRREALTLRDAAGAAGISESAFARAEAGDDVISSTLVAVLKWLSATPTPKRKTKQ